jgi:hypothetical protein
MNRCGLVVRLSASHKETSRRIGQSLKDAGGFRKAADEIQKFIAG